jgi:phosphohistidine phosphatase SixA
MERTPVADERVEYRGPSYARELTSKKLRSLTTVVVVQETFNNSAKRLAVIMPWKVYRGLLDSVREMERKVEILKEGRSL